LKYKQKRFYKKNQIHKKILLLILCIVATGGILAFGLSPVALFSFSSNDTKEIGQIDFDVPYEALEKAMDLDIQSSDEKNHIDWVDTLAYLACKYDGDFKKYSAKDIDSFAATLREDKTLSSLVKNWDSFTYYQKAYDTILGNFLGNYKIQTPIDEDGSVVWTESYGLKAFSPIADGYIYTDYDDFGTGRTYGYKRKHLGHDMMVDIGTPIVAIESGTVKSVGWNEYGGWQIGIQSFDEQRYYYYAHLQKDHPYSANLHEGTAVQAGDVIGYSGRTGYSTKENVNNIDTPHLHVGMRLTFDVTQKDSSNQVWIDMYALTKLLSKNRSQVYIVEETKEYYRSYNFSEPSYYQQQQLLDDTANLRRQNELLMNIVISKNPTQETIGEVSAESNNEGILVPIIMYHGLIKDPVEQTKYFISPSYFENDLIYLAEHGYTTIFMEDLIAYVETGATLPEKPIILSFDDGYYNNYYYAYPLLREYNAKAVISIIGKFTDDFSLLRENNVIYSHITWDQINEMIASGHVEIQNHTYNLHTFNNGRNGAAQKSGEVIASYKTFLESDVGLLQEKIIESTGNTPTTFAYPFGFISKDSDNILKEMGFKATLSCTEGINYIKRDPDALFHLKRDLRPPGKSSAQYFKEMGIE